MTTSSKKRKKGSLKSKWVAKHLILNEPDFDSEDTEVGFGNSTPRNDALDIGQGDTEVGGKEEGMEEIVLTTKEKDKPRRVSKCIAKLKNHGLKDMVNGTTVPSEEKDFEEKVVEIDDYLFNRSPNVDL